MTSYGILTPKADACPFCGCFPVEAVGRYCGKRHFIRCPHCGARTMYAHSTDEAIGLWNQRRKE